MLEELIGGTPAEEDCAQVGVTPNWEELCRLECDVYIAALTGHFGHPPDGCRFRRKPQSHDFGVYYEVAAIAPETEEGSAWIERVSSGLGKWLEGGIIVPPVTYYAGAAAPAIHYRDVASCLSASIEMKIAYANDADRIRGVLTELHQAILGRRAAA